MFDKAFFKLDGRMYTWSGWFGCQLESREWLRVPAGTSRNILGETFLVFRSDREGIKYTTTWSLVGLPENIDKANERLHLLRSRLAALI